ncbi:tyrosine-type recombinase/integrase [Proteiniclasticum sp. C24MP]|uniref:tyrosine-type recombinase/integrase n=1 Tax=Proteiniclasticum sp. C24MP TaxID=3374101 RepID=UPI003754D285
MYKNVNSRGIPKPKEVEPIKKMKDIEKIKQYLRGKDNRRDYLMFVLGINVGLRAGDLLKLRISEVYSGSDVRETVRITEEKTKKVREFTLNRNASAAITYYLEGLSEINTDCYLFPSQKGGHLSVSSAHKIIKNLLRELHIKGNYGTHTLRKTFAYHIYVSQAGSNPMILSTLQKMLNHSSQLTTLRYIGITKEVIEDIYNSINL